MSTESSLNPSLPSTTTTKPPQPPPTIPTLPYTSLIHSLANPATHNQELISLLRTHGFIRLTHHPIPLSQLQTAFAHSRAFFALSPAQKELAPHPPASTGVHRGYSRPGFESVGGTTKGVTGLDAEDIDTDINNNSNISNRKPTPNGTNTENVTAPPTPTLPPRELKESFELGHPLNPHQPNIWPPPDLLPGWEAFMLDFRATLASFSHKLLRAIASGLDLSPDERDAFLDAHAGGNDQLRLPCYPAVSQKELGGGQGGGGLVRMPPHTDWSTITLLFQEQGMDVGGGLEVKSQDGRWIHAGTGAGEGDGLMSVLVNVGDMLMRWTNGVLPSAEHRVGLPPLLSHSSPSPSSATASSSPSSTQNPQIPARFSIPYFVAADAHALVTPFATCVSEERPRRYVPVTQGEYGRVRAMGQFLE